MPGRVALGADTLDAAGARTRGAAINSGFVGFNAVLTAIAAALAALTAA